ncbi:MAG: DUF5107 domain-containing protein [Caldilineaceae bacterium]
MVVAQAWTESSVGLTLWAQHPLPLFTYAAGRRPLSMMAALFFFVLTAACGTRPQTTTIVPTPTSQVTPTATNRVIATPLLPTATATADGGTDADVSAPQATVATATPDAPAAASADTRQGAGSAVESAPALAPVGTVVFYEESVTLPTYPLERYQSDAVDPRYNWPYKRFDVERFRLEAPTPEPRTYRLLVLENAYLKVMIMPELGGRIWQVIHKPSGEPIFYQNSVVKPTHWGHENQLGWLALGGLEWSLPVIEHGYDWGVPWGYIPLPYSEDLAAVSVFTPRDGRLLNASITISLRAGAASFEIEPTITNLGDDALDFSFWHDAMLAPGTGLHPSADLHFVLPSGMMTLHSTADVAMPAPGATFTWPIYKGRDLSRLGNYQEYLGFFEAPAAHGPFVGVYDPAYDIGVARIFPAEVVRGSKVFALGWQDALTGDNYTDGAAMYVELHGGLAPTFADLYTLPAGGQVNWREVWYPVQGIGDLTFANELAALAVTPQTAGLAVGLYPTRPLDGSLVLFVNDVEAARLPIQAQPDSPFHGHFAVTVAKTDTLQIQLQDSRGRVLLSYQPE